MLIIRWKNIQRGGIVLPIVQLPSRVPREYTQKIIKEMKRIKVPATDSRDDALEILREQILRLYDRGKTVQDILDLINSGMVIAKNADIIRIIETRVDVPAEIAHESKPRAKRKTGKNAEGASRDDSGSVGGASRDDSGSTEGAPREALGSAEGARRDDLGSVEGVPREAAGIPEGASREASGSTEGARRDDSGIERGMDGAARDAPAERRDRGTFFVKPDREKL